jgi:hypothetical protein
MIPEVSMNRLRLIPYLAPLVLLLSAGPGPAEPAPTDTPAVESRWASQAAKIDGLDDDWKEARFAVDEGSKAEYAVRNDGDNLFVIVIFRSPLAATTIDFTGLKVFFDLDGKKKKSLGLRFFRKEVTGDQLIAAMEKRGEALPEARKAEMLGGKRYSLYECEVIHPKNALTPSGQAAAALPPAFRSAVHGRVLAYELRIPLSRTNQPGGIGALPGQSVTLGFEWGGMTREIIRDTVGVRAAMGSRAGSRDGGSESGWQDSGDPGNVRDNVGLIPPSEYSRDPRYRKHSFWVEVRLAEAAPQAGDRSRPGSGLR